MNTDIITIADVHRAFAAYASFLRANNLLAPDARLGIDHGSKTYGRAFRLFELHGDSSAHHRPTIGHDFLGMTKAEAFEAITTRHRVAWDALRAAGIEAPYWEADREVVA